MKKLTLWVLGILVVSFGLGVALYEPQNENLDSTGAYSIVKEEDISYAGCKRVSVSVTLPDSESVQNALDAVRDQYMQTYDEVSVFGYRESDAGQVGNTPYTLGKSEASNCE